MGKKRGKMTTKRSRDEKEIEKPINNDVIANIENNFKNSIKVDESDKIINEQNEKSEAYSKKLEAVSKRKDMQLEIEKRKEDLLRTINKIEEKEKEEQQR